MSSSSTTSYVSDNVPTATLNASSMTSSTSKPSNTVNQGSFPKVILQLMEQGLMSTDEQIEELLTSLKYSRNIYALKYILEHKGNSVSVEMLNTAVKSLCSQGFDDVFSGETIIKLEWQLRIIVSIMEQMCQNKCQFTYQFLDGIRQATMLFVVVIETSIRQILIKLLQH